MPQLIPLKASTGAHASASGGPSLRAETTQKSV
jgi:hypothetical protein